VEQYHAPLSKGFGYGIVVGLGAVFALGMIGTTWALKRFVCGVPHAGYTCLVESFADLGGEIPNEDIRMKSRHQKCSQRLVAR